MKLYKIRGLLETMSEAELDRFITVPLCSLRRNVASEVQDSATEARRSAAAEQVRQLNEYFLKSLQQENS